MINDNPTCYIIAGPNGAGKTTFALRYLPDVESCSNFVNADMIAVGLSPLAPEKDRIAASRIFLKEIDNYIASRESFAFETTLSGKGHLRRIRYLRQNGWRVILFYLWLPNVEYSIQRVKERVEHGGHNIPESDIRRRFPKSISNLLNKYVPVCDETICMNNQSREATVIFNQIADHRNIVDNEGYKDLLRSVSDGTN